jgi:hypothetical protein
MSRLPASPIDLHIHSSASDGALEPEAIAAKARALGLRLIAVTDHDRLEASLDLARLLPGQALTGIELSCVEAGDPIDLLGLGLTDPAAISTAISWPTLNVARYRLWTESLALIGVQLDPDAPLEGLPARRVIGAAVAISPALQATLGGRRWPSALQAAMSKGGSADIAPALARSGLLPDVRTGIERIRTAGGVAVWAHPGLSLLGGLSIEPRLSAWVAAGLGGLEVYHPAHDAQVRRQLSAAARHYGLLRSVGSDTHDDPDTLGRAGLVPLEVVEAWLARV